MFQVVLVEKASNSDAGHVPATHKTDGIEILGFYFYLQF